MADNIQIQMIPIGDTTKVIKDTAKLFTVLEGATRDEAAEGSRFISWYPPQKPTWYVRTGKLGQSWDFNVKTGSGRIEGQVFSTGNTAPYNEDVQGDNQLKMFSEIGWRNTSDLSQKFDREFAGRVQKEIDKYFD